MFRKAIGYLNPKVSGAGQERYERRMRDTAKSRGLDLARTLVPNDHMADPVTTLLAMADRLEVDTVTVPSLMHFDRGDVNRINEAYTIVETEHVPAKVWYQGAVISDDPRFRFARRSRVVAQ